MLFLFSLLLFSPLQASYHSLEKQAPSSFSDDLSHQNHKTKLRSHPLPFSDHPSRELQSFIRAERKRKKMKLSAKKQSSRKLINLYESLSASEDPRLACLASFSKAKLLGATGEGEKAMEELEDLKKKNISPQLQRLIQLEKLRIYAHMNCFYGKDPQLLKDAQKILSTFKTASTKEQKIAEALYKILEEQQAFYLFEQMCFYQRKKNKEAAQVYRERLLNRFPMSSYSHKIGSP